MAESRGAARVQARRALVVPLLLAAATLGACGIDGATVESAAGPTTTGPRPASVSTTVTTEATTTTVKPRFTVPKIKPGTGTTNPATTTTSEGSATTTTVVQDGATPGGLTRDEFESELVAKAGLTPAQAACVTEGSWARFDGADLDAIFNADTEEALPPGAAEAFTEIITTCLQGG